jgi:DegV family protein with EDD domain
MSKVIVVTDSVACLPKEVVDKYYIHVIPVPLTVNGKVYKDTEDDLPPSLRQEIVKVPASQIDSTPWPPEVYFEEYRKLGQKSSKIVHIAAFSQFTSLISLASTGATMAMESMPNLTVEVVDSETACIAQGFVTLAAAKVAAMGRDISEVIEAAGAIKVKVKQFFVLETLQLLARTGHVPGELLDWSDPALKVRAMVSLSQGKAEPVSLIRSKSQTIKSLIKVAQDNIVSSKPRHIAVMNVEEPKEAEQLSRKVKEQFHPIEFYQIPLSLVQQVLVGPGLLGFAFYCDE